MTFTWDLKKAANLKKHGIDFREAATVFDDPLSATFPDPDHSAGEQRFLIVGIHTPVESSWCRTLRPAIRFGLSVREPPHGVSESPMKRTRPAPSDDMRTEFDFASMKGGVRGKYVRRAREGTNVVLIEAEVSDALPTEQAVHEALKGVLNTARAVRSSA